MQRRGVKARILLGAAVPQVDPVLAKNILTAQRWYAAIKAGIDGKSAHGLRKYRLTRIAEAGGSAHAITAWGGHASLSEVERHTRTAARKALIVGTEQDQNAVPAGQDGSKQTK
jgi:integrase